VTNQIRNSETPHRDPHRWPCRKAVERIPPTSAPTDRLPRTLVAAVLTLMPCDSYRPELHYMRGPGPRWHAKRDAAVAAHDGGIGVRNWPTTKFAVIVTAAVLSVVFLLSIVTSIIASSSSSLPAAPPDTGCVAVSKSEYQGAARKALLVSRFGSYLRTGRLGRYAYWYCR
jgi:hypothetical protein